MQRTPAQSCEELTSKRPDLYERKRQEKSWHHTFFLVYFLQQLFEVGMPPDLKSVRHLLIRALHKERGLRTRTKWRNLAWCIVVGPVKQALAFVANLIRLKAITIIAHRLETILPVFD